MKTETETRRTFLKGDIVRVKSGTLKTAKGKERSLSELVQRLGLNEFPLATDEDPDGDIYFEEGVLGDGNFFISHECVELVTPTPHEAERRPLIERIKEMTAEVKEIGAKLKLL